MLSILIPTYNYECLGLVEELHRQAQTLSFPVEILIADDASKEEMKRNNRKINRLNNCMFIELKENIGRARIRNFLSEKAQYDLLLFIDSDAGLVSNDFLQKYVSAIHGNDVICGGLLYDRPIPSKQFSLRYYYGISAEEHSAKERNVHPYAKFSSFNFLIRKRIFQKILFDESFSGYGHEDTAFGIELEKRKIKINHIDNPLFHLGLEKNDAFLHKTEMSIENLYRYSDKLNGNVHLLSTFNKVKKYKSQVLLSFIFKKTRELMKKELLSNHPSMNIFAFYKLGYLCYISNKNFK